MATADGDKPTGIGATNCLTKLLLTTDTVLSPLFTTNTVPFLGSTVTAVGNEPTEMDHLLVYG